MEALFGSIDFSDDFGRFRIPDITTRVSIRDEVKNNPENFIYYTIKDSDRLDTICQRAFGSADYMLILLLFNDIYSPESWPVPNNHFRTWYKENFNWDQSLTEVLGYLDSEDRFHDPEAYVDMGDFQTTAQVISVLGLRPITRYDYELKKNEEKRVLKIPLNSVVSEIVRLINNTLGR